MSRRIDKLKPEAQEALKEAMAEMDEMKVNYFIDSTLRTDDEQIAYWYQGRFPLEEVNAKRKIVGFYMLSEKENKYTVTKCDGIKNKSLHQSGLAVDIVPLDSRGNTFWPDVGSPLWKAIADIMVKHGFDAGLYWKDFPDAPHYQLKKV